MKISNRALPMRGAYNSAGRGVLSQVSNLTTARKRRSGSQRLSQTQRSGKRYEAHGVEVFSAFCHGARGITATRAANSRRSSPLAKFDGNDPNSYATNDKLVQMDQRVSAAQSSADNAWMLVSAALVLMMTGPGLALFYGGLV